MGKTFRQLVAESDQEFTVHVASVENIHHSEIMDLVRLALMPYDLREIKKGTYKAGGDEAFGVYAQYPIYSLTVKLGLDVPNESAEQTVAAMTRIDQDKLIVHHQGESLAKAEEDNSDSEAEGTGSSGEGEETTPGEAQSLAGQKRIDTFMKELDSARKDREKDTSQSDVYESFAVSHLGLRGFEPRVSVPRGFYLIERRIGDEPTESLLHVSGPFTRAPENYPFLGNIDLRGINQIGVLPDMERITLRVETADPAHRFIGMVGTESVVEDVHHEVKVTDTDTGKTHTVVVRAGTDAEARDQAVDIVSRREKIGTDRLVASAPDREE